ncbi:penicillin-binding transpeptidase domain-containing protein [Glycomyces paridis]|uniref:Penicillin-binding protein transpeptidase domain-containing protein n=1 Tax=Glycomyces paridis TaxID=2126555 RepID=A0A4S8PDM6_9ACTN|nr:penicillin-binding transpeptidase domain-containing protein [Glycomyces paridis]THV28478.1 hypothetical protein E9998_12860 [Glycomyces paridis]
MNYGNPSHVGRRRERTGPEGAPAGSHRAATGPGYSGRRRADPTIVFSLPLPGRLGLDFTRMRLKVAGAVALVAALGVAIVLWNLPGAATGGAAPENAAFLYTGGQALPAGFAEEHPALMDTIAAELEARYGLTPEDLYDAGSRPDAPRVVLTLDRTLQETAEAASGEAGVVAVEPGTGAVLCYYGAESETGADQIGSAAPHPPSSVFDMITAATALEGGASIDSWWTDGEEAVTLTEAVRESRGEAMDAVAAEYGAEGVLDTAAGMGLTAIADEEGNLRDLAEGDYEGLDAADFGAYPVSVVDMAAVYATIAAGGVHAETHFIDRVVDGEDRTVEATQGIRTNQAVAETTAQDLQFVGLGESEAIEGRDFFAVAAEHYGETTQSWFVGAIPQLSVAAWANGSAAADGGIPLWRSVLDTAIEVNGYEAEELPGASGEGEDLTEGIADEDGNIDPDSAYCQANPDEPACAATPSDSPSESDSPSPDETSEEPEPEPTSDEPEPEPTTSEAPEESTSEDCPWIWC